MKQKVHAKDPKRTSNIALCGRIADVIAEDQGSTIFAYPAVRRCRLCEIRVLAKRTAQAKEAAK